ncbi:MAG: DUF748 domain-containing protein [Candidatus Omnitrophota bacterium]
MKKFLKILLIIVLVLALAGLAASVYFMANARRIIMARMETSLGVPVEISAFKVFWPLSVQIQGLVVGKNIKVETIRIKPGLEGLMSGGLVFHEIFVEKPYVKVIRKSDNTMDVGLPAREEDARMSFAMRQLVVQGGRVEFRDESLAEPFVIMADDIRLDARQASLVKLTLIDFDASATLATAQGEKAALVTARGWIDWLPKDMEAVLEVSDGNLVPFSPYYKKYVKKDLQAGGVRLKADLKARANDLNVNCHVELADISFRIEGQQGQEGGGKADINDLTSLALNSILSSEGGATFDFSFRTKLDKPKFENMNIRGSFLQNRIRAVISQPPDKTVEQYKQIGEQFEAIGKELKNIFKK